MNILGILRLERAIGVTMHMHSGKAIRFTVDGLDVDVNALGKLTRFQWTGARDAPLHIDPARIEAIETRRVWRRRT